MHPLELLNARRYAELDLHCAELQRRYESGAIDESQLAAAFDRFGTEWLPVDAGLRAWREACPQSYAAALAHAQWLLRFGLDARGAGTADTVSAQAWRTLESCAAQAVALLESYLGAVRIPVQAYVLLGRIGQVAGGQGGTIDPARSRYPEWYRRGIELAPDSLKLREQLIACLRPEWGGSARAMSDFVAAHADSPHRRAVQVMEQRCLLHYAGAFCGDLEGARRHYTQAELLAPGSSANAYWLALSHIRHEDLDRGRALLRQALASEDGSVDAFWVLVDYLFDEEHAAERRALLRARAERGSVRAMARLGKDLMWDAKRRVDPAQAREAQVWLRQAWDAGDAGAGNQLAHALYRGQVLERDRAGGARLALESARAGSKHSCVLVWDIHQDGGLPELKLDELADVLQYGISVEYPGALSVAATAIEQGTLSMDAEGRLQPAPTMPDAAQMQVVLKLRTDAAEQGSEYHKSLLADLLERGATGVERDPQGALYWYSEAANAGDAWSSYRLGLLLQDDLLCKPDLERARELLESALTAEVKDARRELGLLLLRHPRDRADAQRGRSLLEQCALQDADAQAYEGLVWAHLSERGATADPATAKRWMDLAVNARQASPWVLEQRAMQEGSLFGRAWLRWKRWRGRGAQAWIERPRAS